MQEKQKTYTQKVTDKGFNTSFHLEQFRQAEPDTPILMAGPSKVIKQPPGTPFQFTAAWRYSLRGVLILTPTFLAFMIEPKYAKFFNQTSGFNTNADFRLSYQDILKAELITIQQGFIKGLLLRLHVDNDQYLFGLNNTSEWHQQLPFPVEYTTEKMKWTRERVVAVIKVILFFLLIGIAVNVVLYMLGLT